MEEFENWKDIPQYEGLYQISTLGRVKSLPKKVNCNRGERLVEEKILKMFFQNSGYLTVSLSKNGKYKTYLVHQLMAITFLNHKPNKTEIVVDHIDNIKTNNALTNIQLTTSRINNSKDKQGRSKYTGVSFHKLGKKWRSQIKIGNKAVHLGSFDTEEEAHQVYLKKLSEISEGKQQGAVKKLIW